MEDLDMRDVAVYKKGSTIPTRFDVDSHTDIDKVASVERVDFLDVITMDDTVIFRDHGGTWRIAIDGNPIVLF